jgi:hypothetical protein
MVPLLCMEMVQPPSCWAEYMESGMAQPPKCWAVYMESEMVRLSSCLAGCMETETAVHSPIVWAEQRC